MEEEGRKLNMGRRGKTEDWKMGRKEGIEDWKMGKR